MIPDKYKNLINKAIDGELSSEEEIALNTHLADNPEMLSMYQGLKQTSDLLETVPEIEPPAGLKPHIIQQIDFSKYMESKRQLTIKSLFPDWLFVPQAKLAYSFALGLLCGIIAISPYVRSWMTDQDIDSSQLTGTLIAPESDSFKTIKVIPIENPGLFGDIKVKRSQSIILFEILLTSEEQTELRFEYNSEQFYFSGLEPNEYSKISYDYGPNFVELNTPNSLKIALYLRQLDPSTTLNLSLKHSGNIVFSQELALK